MTWNLAVGCAIGIAAVAVVLVTVRIVKYFVAVYRVVASVDRRPRRLDVANITQEPNDRGGT